MYFATLKKSLYLDNYSQLIVPHLQLVEQEEGYLSYLRARIEDRNLPIVSRATGIERVDSEFFCGVYLSRANLVNMFISCWATTFPVF